MPGALALVGACLALALAASPGPGSTPLEAAGRSAAGPGDPEQAARALETRLAGVRGLSAQFTQTVDSPALSKPLVESGTVYLLRPGRMRWQYRDPAGKLAIADGARTWLYLPEDRQVIVAPMPTAQNDPGVGLLMAEHPDLLAGFEARWGSARSPGGRPPLALKPRSADAPFDEVLIDVDASGFPETLTVVDPLGGRVVYRLSAIDFRPPTDPSLFTFTPPPGVDVRHAAP